MYLINDKLETLKIQDLLIIVQLADILDIFLLNVVIVNLHIIFFISAEKKRKNLTSSSERTFPPQTKQHCYSTPAKRRLLCQPSAKIKLLYLQQKDIPSKSIL